MSRAAFSQWPLYDAEGAFIKTFYSGLTLLARGYDDNADGTLLALIRNLTLLHHNSRISRL